MDLKNLSKDAKNAIAIVVLGIAAAAVLIWTQHSMGPLNLNMKATQIESKEGELEKQMGMIRKGKQAQAKLDELQRDIAALEQKLVDLKQILPTEPELGDLLKWIKALADQTNLELDVFNPQGLVEQEFLREQPIQMEVRGTYHQLGLFFDRIGKYARIINVENVNVRQARAGGDSGAMRVTIGATFTAKTFIYREPAAGQPGGGA